MRDDQLQALGPSGRIKTQARALRPTAAIDRPADRTAWLIGRRTGRFLGHACGINL
jgi:hypothetical protein